MHQTLLDNVSAAIKPSSRRYYGLLAILLYWFCIFFQPAESIPALAHRPMARYYHYWHTHNGQVNNYHQDKPLCMALCLPAWKDRFCRNNYDSRRHSLKPNTTPGTFDRAPHNILWAAVWLR